MGTAKVLLDNYDTFAKQINRIVARLDREWRRRRHLRRVFLENGQPVLRFESIDQVRMQFDTKVVSCTIHNNPKPSVNSLREGETSL